MAYEVQVDHARRLIAVTGHGSGRTEDTLGLIAEHSATLRSCPGYDLLYDSSRLAIESSPAEMIRVAGALLGQRPGAFRRLAIVVPEQRMNLARIFAALAQPFGVTANVFLDAEDALSWLGVDSA